MAKVIEFHHEQRKVDGVQVHGLAVIAVIVLIAWAVYKVL